MSEPKRAGLLELLKASPGCQFVIPVYQRNYTWTADDQVKQYLFDLEGSLNVRYIPDSNLVLGASNLIEL